MGGNPIEFYHCVYEPQAIDQGNDLLEDALAWPFAIWCFNST